MLWLAQSHFWTKLGMGALNALHHHPMYPLLLSGITGRGTVPPPYFWLGNFCWPTGKKRGKKKMEKGENGEEKKENCKRKGGKLKMEGGKCSKKSRGQRTSSFFFVFLFFLFFTFKNDENLFWVYQIKMEIFYREEAFHTGKKIRKNDLAPLEKFSCYAPALTILICHKLMHLSR